jgi:hypothetical protein
MWCWALIALSRRCTTDYSDVKFSITAITGIVPCGSLKDIDIVRTSSVNHNLKLCDAGRSARRNPEVNVLAPHRHGISLWQYDFKL